MPTARRILLTSVLIAALVSTAHASGGAGFLGGSATSNSATYYAGPTTSATQTTANAFWVTSQAMGACAGVFAVQTAPGAGNSWAITLHHGAPGDATSCASASLTEVSLCTISDTNRSCSYSVSPTIAANSCVQLKSTAGGAPSATIAQTYSLHCTPSGGDGMSTYAAASTDSFSGTRYLGHATSSGTTTGQTYWIAGANYRRLNGGVRLVTAPGAGKSWAVKVRYSSTALGATTDCEDITDTTSGTLCTIGNSDVHCAFSNADIDVPVGGCVQYELEPGGSPAATGGEQYTIHATTSTGNAADAGNGYHGFRIATTALYGGYLGSSGSNYPNSYWLTGSDAVTTCSGTVSLDTGSAGNDGMAWPVSLGYGALTGANHCGAITPTTTSTLCTLIGRSAGGASCSFTGVAVAPGALGCLGIRIGTATGSPTGNISYALHCNSGAAPPTPTRTSPPGCCDNATPGLACHTPVAPWPTPSVTPCAAGYVYAGGSQCQPNPTHTP